MGLNFNSSNIVFGQDKELAKPEWADESFRQKTYPDALYYIYYEEIAVNKKDVESFKKKLEENLKQGLSQNIYNAISVKNSSNTFQVNNSILNSFAQSFSSNTSITSNVILTSAVIYTQPDVRKKICYGLIIVAKRELAKFYSAIIQNNITTIGYQIKSSDNTSTSDELRKIIISAESLISDAENQINILTSIDPSQDISFYTHQLGECRISLGMLKNRVNTKEIEEDVQNAEKLFKNAEYEKALTLFIRVLIVNPNNERAKTGKAESLDYIDIETMKNIVCFENKNQFDFALEKLDYLFKLDKSFISKYTDLYNKLAEKFFQKSIENIQSSLKYNDANQAELVYDKASPYAILNKNKFDALGEKIAKLKLKNDIANIRQCMYKSQFEDAYRLLTKTQRQNTYNPKLLKLGNAIDNNLYRKSKCDFKLTRPHLYCLKLGYNVWTEFYPIKNISNNIEGISRITPFYSIALYRKINIKEKFAKKNRDISNSNLIGVKFGVLDQSNQFILNNKIDTISYKIANKFLCETQLSFLAWKFLNLNIGVLTNTSLTKMNKSNIYYYSSTAGFKIPIWVFDFDLNIKYFTDLKAQNLLVLESGISLNFNLKRKFNKKNKESIWTEIKNIKSKY